MTDPHRYEDPDEHDDSIDDREYADMYTDWDDGPE